MKGYKVFNSEWQCRDFQYKVGEVAETTEPVVVCKSGLHFCLRALDCLKYYPFSVTNRYAEVEAVGNVDVQHDKCATDRLLVVRELSSGEFVALCTGVIIGYHSNGQKKSEYNYVQGQTHGICTTWDPTGAKISEVVYMNGLYHGPYTIWYNNGSKQLECSYENGYIHGLYTVWHGDGTKYEEKNYNRGNLQRHANTILQ